MTTTDPDRIREDIERTREELGQDVDALADKVRPSSIANRQVGKVRSAFSNAKDRLMGTASDVKETGSNVVSTAASKVAEAPAVVKRQTEGHPVAVGLIALGVGMLASALIPATRRERELAGTVRERTAPLVGELGEAARGAASNLKEPAQNAVNAVKDTAADAMQSVKGEGMEAASEVRDSARQAKDRMTSGGQSMDGSGMPPSNPGV